MSRSYKKHNFIKDPAVKGMKRCANKKVRHTKYLSNGGAYKKCFESWDISDYKYQWTKEDAINEYNARLANPEEWHWFLEKFETLEKYLIYWEKCTKRK